MTVLTGIVYPLLVTVIAQTFAPFEANGSFIKLNDRIVGSRLIGQKFTSQKYFWGRPSASDYDALKSGGSNLGPISAELKKLVAERKALLLEANGIRGETVIPSDLLFASGSGLDPHISVKAFIFQLDRVVKARGWNEADSLKIKSLVVEMINKDKIDLLGMPYVNVL